MHSYCYENLTLESCIIDTCKWENDKCRAICDGITNTMCTRNQPECYWNTQPKISVCALKNHCADGHIICKEDYDRIRYIECNTLTSVEDCSKQFGCQWQDIVVSSSCICDTNFGSTPSKCSVQCNTIQHLVPDTNRAQCVCTGGYEKASDGTCKQKQKTSNSVLLVLFLVFIVIMINFVIGVSIILINKQKMKKINKQLLDLNNCQM